MQHEREKKITSRRDWRFQSERNKTNTIHNAENGKVKMHAHVPSNTCYSEWLNDTIKTITDNTDENMTITTIIH